MAIFKVKLILQLRPGIIVVCLIDRSIIWFLVKVLSRSNASQSHDMIREEGVCLSIRVKTYVT